MKTINQATEEFCEKRRLETKGYPPKQWFRAGVDFAQEWIAVEEELPEDGVHVLCKKEVGSISKTISYTVAFYNSKAGKFSQDFDWSYTTHWRPIERK